MLEFLIALPIFGELLFAFFIVLPLMAPIIVIEGFTLMFDDEFFLGLLMIAAGIGTAILTWPFAFGLIADAIKFIK